MKRLLIALAMVAMLAAPALSAPVDISVSGEFWGTFTVFDGDNGFFDTASWFSPSENWWSAGMNEYSHLNLHGHVGDNFAFTATYNVPWNQLDQAYGAYLPQGGPVSEIRAGKFNIPIGLNEYINTFGSGVAILGSLGRIDYNLSYFTGSEFQDAWTYDDPALNLRLQTTAGTFGLGATVLHDPDDANLFGVDVQTGVGPFSFKAEYLFANIYGDFTERDLYVSGSYAYTDRTSFFVDYYNSLYDADPYDGLKAGVIYKINDNASLRAMFVNGDVVYGPGFESALKVSF